MLRSPICTIDRSVRLECSRFFSVPLPIWPFRLFVFPSHSSPDVCIYHLQRIGNATRTARSHLFRFHCGRCARLAAASDAVSGIPGVIDSMRRGHDMVGDVHSNFSETRAHADNDFQSISILLLCVGLACSRRVMEFQLCRAFLLIGVIDANIYNIYRSANQTDEA